MKKLLIFTVLFICTFMLFACGGGDAADTTAPSAPAGLTATTISVQQINLSWSAASDNTGVAGYKIYRNSSATPQQSVTGTMTFDRSLSADIKYCYQVSAYDDASNESALSTSSCDTTPVGKLPDTGQITSNTTTFGEDSDYTINPPSYTDNGDDTVTDNVTDLMWQQRDDNVNYNWYEATGTADAINNPGGATDVCGNLTLAGFTDWRLPSKKELISIVDYNSINPVINTTLFPGTDWGYYLSSTVYAGSPSDVWDVDFSKGIVMSGSKAFALLVRCVR